jgi:hypothetical protein
MFESLFGSEMPLAARFFIAFLVVLALIGLTAWLVRRFGSSRLGGGSTRGRQPRLAVIDAASVDGRRRLVLIRRDNIEHLLMIGGPSDVVIEPNIVRASGAREPGRPSPEATTRAASATETAWPLQPSNEPPPVAPIAPPRGYRGASTDEPWLPPEPGARPRPADNVTPLAAEFSSRPAPPEKTAPPARQEPPPVATSAGSETPGQSDRNLAEMAQQLEAALRRAPTPEGRPPVTDPLAAAPTRPSRDPRARAEPRFDKRPELRIEPVPAPKAEPRFESKSDPRPAPKIEPAPEPSPAPKAEPKAEAPVPEKAFYDNLEEEMASLLGRPPGKS